MTAGACYSWSNPDDVCRLVSVLQHDIEFLRLLLLWLEERQVSPRATVIIDLHSEAVEMDCDPLTLEDGLCLLLDLDYIEGPGSEDGGLWLFRKLSHKGSKFVQSARLPADWSRLKRHYAGGPTPFKPL